MNYIRLVLGVIVGLLGITLVAECKELTIVKSVSGKSFETLQANQQEYFDIRSRTPLDVGLFTVSDSCRNLDWI